MDAIAVTKTDKGWSATFTKQSGNGARLGETKALIVLSGSPLVITEERDAPYPRQGLRRGRVHRRVRDPRGEEADGRHAQRDRERPQARRRRYGPGDDGRRNDRRRLGRLPSRSLRAGPLSWTVYPNGRLDVSAGAWFTTDPSGQTMDSEKATKLSEDDRKKVTVACGPPADSHTGAGH